VRYGSLLRLAAAGIVCVLVVLPAGLARAQDREAGSTQDFRSWYMYFGDHPVKEGPWGIHFDGQLRVVGFGEAKRQFLVRPAVNFDLSDSVQLSGGYAYVRTYPAAGPAGFDTPEHRLWEQVLVRQRLGRWSVVHRPRLEQRFVGRRADGDADELPGVAYAYKNRFRYFLKGTMPMGDASRLYVALYNEVMLNFGANRGTAFDQNRSYATLGFRLGSVNLEFGYLLQIVQRGGGGATEYNHTLQVGFFSAVPLGR